MPAPKAPVLDGAGKKSKDVTLEAEVFGVDVKPHLVHEVVRAEFAKHRAGTKAVKSRGLVSGRRFGWIMAMSLSGLNVGYYLWLWWIGVPFFLGMALAALVVFLLGLLTRRRIADGAGVGARAGEGSRNHAAPWIVVLSARSRAACP